MDSNPLSPLPHPSLSMQNTRLAGFSPMPWQVGRGRAATVSAAKQTLGPDGQARCAAAHTQRPSGLGTNLPGLKLTPPERGDIWLPSHQQKHCPRISKREAEESPATHLILAGQLHGVPPAGGSPPHSHPGVPAAPRGWPAMTVRRADAKSAPAPLTTQRSSGVWGLRGQ